MPRPARASQGGVIYHVLNRGTGGIRLFRKQRDFDAFIKLLDDAADATVPMRVLGLCLMHTHWHLVLWPKEDGDLSTYVGWLSNAHVRRRHTHYHTHGTGHLYQGRFKSFPVQDDDHFLTLMRYVEANPVRAKIVAGAQDWKWSSLALRGAQVGQRILSDWPVERPQGWTRRVNAPMRERALAEVRAALTRGRPFGSDAWMNRIARRLGLESTLRPRGRPSKKAVLKEKSR